MVETQALLFAQQIFPGNFSYIIFYNSFYYWIFCTKLVSLWDQDLKSIQAMNRFFEKCTTSSLHADRGNWIKLSLSVGL